MIHRIIYCRFTKSSGTVKTHTGAATQRHTLSSAIVRALPLSFIPPALVKQSISAFHRVQATVLHQSGSRVLFLRRAIAANVVRATVASPAPVSTASDMTTARTGQAGLFSTEIETPLPIALTVEGKLPEYLQGALYRNGPGVFETPHADGQETPLRHWFDGVGMLHRFDIDGKRNTVNYNSRVCAPGILRAAAAVTKSKYSSGVTFGVQDPCKGIFSKLFSMFLPSGGTKDPANGSAPVNVSVTIEQVPGKGVVGRSDFSTMMKFDPDNLEVREFLNWAALEGAEGTTKKDLTGLISAAHGQFDPTAQEYYNYVYNFGPDPGTYKILCVGPSGKAEVVAQIRDYCSYVHSMSLTENYLIFIVCPTRINAIWALFEKSLMGAMHFDEHAGTKFYVVSRKEKRVVATYASESFWTFHTINAFEDPTTGDIHIDMCRYDNANCIEEFYVENLRSKPASFFSAPLMNRYTLANISEASSSSTPSLRKPLQATRRELSPVPFELPRMNEKFHMKPYRYAYGPGWGGSALVAGKEKRSIMSEIVKVDLVDQEKTKLWSAKETLVGEAIFVADPAGSAEDDGVLCFVAYDTGEGRSALVVVDARSMTEVARADCATRVPAGFHGRFVEC